MRKLSLCFVLLALSTLTFVGCGGGDASKPIPPKPDSTKPADETTPAADVDKPADATADPAAPVADPAK